MSRLEKIGRLKEKAYKRSAKRSKRKEELADFAIDALKQLGYARTSLRDIAEHSGVSVGTLHYYFEDKVDLISFCVRKYKEDFIAEMDNILLGSLDSNAIVEGFASGLAYSVRNDSETHRLWYDIRTQAMFEEEFHEVVGEIENGLIDLVRRLMKRLDMPEEVVLPVYMNLDGAFRYYLQRYLIGEETAVEDFRGLVSAQLGQLVSSGVAE
ncbi:MAG: TetR/AcrR family transcriptional regulator [Rhodobacteraceae bacterium]|nr:TetR/AcrR family transcriptional regulator [Paracoccaceae bacterium]